MDYTMENRSQWHFYSCCLLICPLTAHLYCLPLSLTFKFQADHQFANVMGFHSQRKVSAKDY